MSNIVISGYYGFGNAGDEAMLCAIIDAIRKEEADAHITVISGNPKETSKKHNINAVAGTEFITNYESSIGASRQRYDYTNDTFRYLDFGGTEVTYAGFLSEVGATVTLIAMSDMNGYDGLYFVQ